MTFPKNRQKYECSGGDTLGNQSKSVTVREWLILCHCNQLNFTIRLINWELKGSVTETRWLNSESL